MGRARSLSVGAESRNVYDLFLLSSSCASRTERTPLQTPPRRRLGAEWSKVCKHASHIAAAAAIVATAIVLQPSRPSAVAAAGDAAAASAGADGAPAGAAVGAAACSCCFATLLRRLSSRSTATDLFQATSLRLSSPQGAQRSVPKQQPWHRIYFIATRRCCQRGTHTNGTAYPRGTLYVRTQVSHTHT